MRTAYLHLGAKTSSPDSCATNKVRPSGIYVVLSYLSGPIG